MNTKQKAINPILVHRKITAYLGVMAVALAVGGYFGATQLIEYNQTNEGLDKAKIKLEELRLSAGEMESQYQESRKKYIAFNQDLTNSLQKILPENEEYTTLVTDLDNYIQSNNSAANPLFMSDIRFENAQLPKDSQYSVLPVNMTIEGSKTAIKNFLKFIESTGDTNTPSRLMDIQSITLNFTDRDEENKENPRLNVNLRINAYFQQKEVAKK